MPIYISSLNDDIYWRNMSLETLQNEYIFNLTLVRITFVDSIINIGNHTIGMQCKQYAYRNITYERQILHIWLLVNYFKRRHWNMIQKIIMIQILESYQLKPFKSDAKIV